MTLTQVTAPATEPVTVDDAKLHLRISHADDDALIESLIVAARQHVESFTHRALITQVWDLKLDEFPSSDESIWFPKAPLLTSTAPVVTYTDAAGDSQTWSSSYYTVDAPSGPHARRGRIFLNYGQTYPGTRVIDHAVSIRFYCGYGSATAVPEPIKAAMKLLMGHWFTNREAVSANALAPVPQSVDALLWPFKSF
jgi:uncharacterized phiE125 gp8 family phage protein